MAGARGGLVDRPDRRTPSPARARRPAASGPRRELADVGARIRRGDRVTILGKTGSGKSTFARILLRSYSRVVLIDPKGRAELDEWPIVYGVEAFRQAWPTAPRVIVRPGPGEVRRKWLDAVCWHIFAFGETALNLDDTLGVVTANQSCAGLDACLGQGREIGITGVVCSQRPSKIPLTILSEADHLVVFTLQLRTDRDTVAGVIGPYENPAAGEHGFLYWHGSLTSAVDCRPLERVG